MDLSRILPKQCLRKPKGCLLIRASLVGGYFIVGLAAIISEELSRRGRRQIERDGGYADGSPLQ